MATITRGPTDELLLQLKGALDAYERDNPTAIATLYRQNSASIRVRIVDDGFIGLSRGERQKRVWGFLSDRVPQDDLEEVSVLLLISQAEQNSSFLNSEFNDPVSSGI